MSFRGTNCTKFAANSFTSRPVIWTYKSYLDTNARPVVDTTFGGPPPSPPPPQPLKNIKKHHNIIAKQMSTCHQSKI